MSTAPRSLNHAEFSNGSAVSEKFENRYSDDRSPNPLSAPWVWVLALCCVVAIGISGYLTWASLTSSKIAGCGSGNVFDCSHVTSSKWSLWMGLPVSALAIGSYLGLATALGVAVFQTSVILKRFAWTAVALFAISAGLAAIWFTGLQVFVLKHLCSYCLTAHACGIIAALVAVWKVPNRIDVKKFATPLATVGITVLIVGQIYQPEPVKFRIETFEPAATQFETFDAPAGGLFEAPLESAEAAVFEAPVAATKRPNTINALMQLFSPEHFVSAVRPAITMLAFTSPLQSGNASNGSGAKPKKSKRRTVGINGGTIQLDVKQWPLNGSVEARHIFVEMLDYNCPNCRKTHKAITGAKQLLNGDVSVMILPIPLNTACNSAVTKTDPKFIESCDIAKLAVAVWRTDADKFGQFHEAMFASAQPLTLAQATDLAKSLVDGAKLDAEIASRIPGRYIESMVQLYDRSGKGGVPKLMFPGTSIVGEFTSSESLADVIRQQTK